MPASNASDESLLNQAPTDRSQIEATVRQRCIHGVCASGLEDTATIAGIGHHVIGTSFD